MKRRYFLIASASLLSACANPDTRPNPSQGRIVKISAAISLQKPLQEIQPLYERDRISTKLIYNFGASGSLQQQIEQGAPVDIFVSASPVQMDALQQKNLLQSQTRKNLVGNRLVLVAPKNSTLTSFANLAESSVKRVAIGEPKSVPAGQYAQKALRFYRIENQVLSKAIYGKDVRQVLTYVETGNVDAGIVYLSDARSSTQVKIVATAPAKSHAKIIYSIAQLQRSQNPEAQNFIQFLDTKPAQSIFKKYGFTQP